MLPSDASIASSANLIKVILHELFGLRDNGAASITVRLGSNATKNPTITNPPKNGKFLSSPMGVLQHINTYDNIYRCYIFIDQL